MRSQSIFGFVLLLAFASSGQEAWAHAEHGTGEPVPQVANLRKLPKGIDLVVVKTTAHQFSLSTDGKQEVEVLGDDGEPFIKVQQHVVLANFNSPYWYRAQRPGGGPVPARLKAGEQFLKLKPDWKPVAEQAGFGWYDLRLVDEGLMSFKLALRINGVQHAVTVERKPAAAFAGYWTSRLTREPASIGLSALIPGLSTGAIALSRTPASQATLEILDAAGKPFIRSTAQGYWVKVAHPWFKDLGLFVNTENPDTRKDWGDQWVKASEASMLTYQDPRLQAPKGQSKTARTWNIPVRAMEDNKTEQFAGDMQWRAMR